MPGGGCESARHKRSHNALIRRWFGTSAVGVEWMWPTRPARRPPSRLALRALHGKRWQIAVTAFVCRTRGRLDRARDVAWERDIRELLDDGGRIRD